MTILHDPIGKTVLVSFRGIITLPVSEVPEILISTARISGTILFIAATSQIAAWVFTYDGLPEKVAGVLQAMHLGPLTGMLIIGIFMDAIPACLSSFRC